MRNHGQKIKKHGQIDSSRKTKGGYDEEWLQKKQKEDVMKNEEKDDEKENEKMRWN